MPTLDDARFAKPSDATSSANLTPDLKKAAPQASEPLTAVAEKSHRVVAIAVVALLGCAILGWFLFGYQSNLSISDVAPPQTAETNSPQTSGPPIIEGEIGEVALPPDILATSSESPTIQGRYRAFIADQDVTFEWKGDFATAPNRTGGTATYTNRVSGGGCVARLVPDEGARGDKVQFSQVPIVGRTPCERSIPVQLTVAGTGGLANILHANWLDPSSGQSVMSGDLTRTDGQ